MVYASVRVLYVEQKSLRTFPPFFRIISYILIICTFAVAAAVVTLMLYYDRQWFYAFYLFWLGVLFLCLSLGFNFSIFMLLKSLTQASRSVTNQARQAVWSRAIVVLIVTAVSVSLEIIIGLRQLKDRQIDYEIVDKNSFDWRNGAFMWVQFVLIALGLWYSW